LKPQDLTRWGFVCALDRVGQLPHLNFESFSSTSTTNCVRCITSVADYT
jgi:hypothetical protein